jgi:hypothetical protein
MRSWPVMGSKTLTVLDEVDRNVMAARDEAGTATPNPG